MRKIKKPLITQIAGNRHALGFAARRACSLLIAIIFLFTGTGYSASGPLKLRPVLQFSDTGKEAIRRKARGEQGRFAQGGGNGPEDMVQNGQQTDLENQARKFVYEHKVIFENLSAAINRIQESWRREDREGLNRNVEQAIKIMNEERVKGEALTTSPKVFPEVYGHYWQNLGVIDMILDLLHNNRAEGVNIDMLSRSCERAIGILRRFEDVINTGNLGAFEAELHAHSSSYPINKYVNEGTDFRLSDAAAAGGDVEVKPINDSGIETSRSCL